MPNQDKINEFNNQLLVIIEKFQEELPPCEISHALIVNGVSMNLSCAPSGELLGMQTTLSSIQYGIAHYEETHS